MADLRTFSDQDLLLLTREGNERAFGEIYRRYKGVLFLHAMRMLNDREVAKDLVQELFVTLWHRRDDLAIHSSLSSYLYSSVRNRVLDQFARTKNQNDYLQSLTSLFEEGECVTDHPTRENQLAELIDREVTLLPLKMQKVFELSRKGNLSYREIADRLNISDKTVKKQVSNALTILRKRLDLALIFCLSLWTQVF